MASLLTRERGDERAISRRFAAGEEIFRMSDPAHNAYIIERGNVEVSTTRVGEKTVIAELGNGEIFGEMSMIDDAPRSATVTATEDTQVIVIDRARFQRPRGDADPLMNMLLRVFLTRLRETQQKLSGTAPDPGEIDPTTREIQQLALARIKLEDDMRRAFEAREFEMHYQPIVALKDGRLAGFEALMRWRRKDGSLVPPVEFIPLAEETGLIVELGRWAMERAIKDQIRFAQCIDGLYPGQPPSFMSVNVSGMQLSDLSEIDLLADIIKGSGVDPSVIKLEMTETLLVENPDRAAEALAKIKELGVSIAIDDFGTGYSSLSYLHRFPLDTLKIDRAFVSSMTESENSRRIVNSITQLAGALQMDVVAEGIEEKAQMDALRDLGCAAGQGYYFAKPASAAMTMALIGSQPGW
jgi:EAL domain-containing protein (putative c-di-GMP-specific phosphodiesterase class I)